MAKNAAAPALDPSARLAEIDALLDGIIGEQGENESADILPSRKCELLTSELDQMKTDIDKRIISYIRVSSDRKFAPLRALVERLNPTEWREFLLVANRVAVEKYLQALITEHTPPGARGDKERNQIAAKLATARRELEIERESLCTKYNYERRRDCLIEIVIAWNPPKQFDVTKVRDINGRVKSAAAHDSDLDEALRECHLAIAKAKSLKEQAQELRDTDAVQRQEAEISQYSARVKELEKEKLEFKEIRSSRDRVLQNARTFLRDHGGIELNEYL